MIPADWKWKKQRCCHDNSQNPRFCEQSLLSTDDFWGTAMRYLNAPSLWEQFKGFAINTNTRYIGEPILGYFYGRAELLRL